MSFDFPQPSKSAPTHRPKGGGKLIFLVIGVALFFFMNSGRGNNETDQQRQQAEPTQQGPQYKGLPETGNADRTIERRERDRYASPSAGNRAMPKNDRASSGDWSLEAVETRSNKLKSKSTNQKTTDGDWSLEEVDGKKKASPPKFEFSGPSQSGVADQKDSSGNGDWSIETENQPKNKSEKTTTGDWSIEGVKPKK